MSEPDPLRVMQEMDTHLARLRIVFDAALADGLKKVDTADVLAQIDWMRAKVEPFIRPLVASPKEGADGR